MSFKCGSVLAKCFLSFVRTMLYPSYITLNWLLSLYITTTEEDRYPLKLLFKKLFLTPIYGGLFILCLPLLLIFLPIRCVLVRYRQPFLYSEKHTAYTEQQAQFIDNLIWKGGYQFGIASANICLMPELASKMNNLVNVDKRAKDIGERVIVSQFFNDDWTKRQLHFRSYVNNSVNFTNKKIYNQEVASGDGIRKAETTEIVGDITTTFPHLDFLAIQEAFSSYHNKALIEKLHCVFPYIVHDVGAHSFKNNHFTLNSGLFLASRHPIIAVDFKPFSYFTKHGKIMSSGLLMVKVTIGKARAGLRNVGYIFITHLQSYQGKALIIPKQLAEIHIWIKEFIREQTTQGEHVLFKILCGDLNFDNLSPADKESTQHVLFDEFIDVCRLKAGCDKPWTVGTEMRQDCLFDTTITTPEGLKLALEDPVLRQMHIIDADIVEHTKEALTSGKTRMDEQNNVIIFPEGGRRRIDYIMYHKSSPVELGSHDNHSESIDLE